MLQRFVELKIVVANRLVQHHLNKQNNNFVRASRFFVHFFAVFARLRRENT